MEYNSGYERKTKQNGGGRDGSNMRDRISFSSLSYSLSRSLALSLSRSLSLSFAQQ